MMVTNRNGTTLTMSLLFRTFLLLLCQSKKNLPVINKMLCREKKVLLANLDDTFYVLTDSLNVRSSKCMIIKNAIWDILWIYPHIFMRFRYNSFGFGIWTLTMAFAVAFAFHLPILCRTIYTHCLRSVVRSMLISVII